MTDTITVTVYELHYSQNGADADAGPSIGTFWDRETAERIATRSGDLVVVAVDVPEAHALEADALHWFID